jgi:protocatechuate 3,4-dioxygenase beta subunit
MTRTTVTDAAGSFRVDSLLPGRWNVLVGQRDNPTARHNEVTVAGADVTLEPIVLPQMYSVVVRVKDDQGRAVSGAVVTGRGSVGGAIEGTSDAGGEARFDSLPSGRWRVFANTTDGKRGVSLADVPLVNSGAIEVTVRNKRRSW